MQFKAETNYSLIPPYKTSIKQTNISRVEVLTSQQKTWKEDEPKDAARVTSFCSSISESLSRAEGLGKRKASRCKQR